jgi:hypothetical protein
MKQWVIVILILIWLGFHYAIPVDSIGVDLWRHIKNGELILKGNKEVLYHNFYSFTNPDYPFTNHHWLFGVFCYVLYFCFGFTGLCFIYLLLELFTFYLFFRCWQRYSSFILSCAFGLLSFPLITYRTEIRPEGMSNLFCGVFLFLLDSYQQKRLKSSYLLMILFLTQVIWVNTHIFFIMGPLLTVLFLFQAWFNGNKEETRFLINLFFLLLLACLINPFGLNGLLLPFKNYASYFSYPILENYPVLSLLKVEFLKPVIFYFLAVLGLLVVALVVFIKKQGLKQHIFVVTLALILSLAAMKANRMIGIFGFFWIPLMSYIFTDLNKSVNSKFKNNLEIIILAIGIIISASINFNWNQRHALGILPRSQDVAEFIIKEKLSEPIFNNANIGSYLIFYLSPEYKVFVDNRWEAYPVDFMSKDLYEKYWHELERKYHFNTIVVTPEHSPWMGRFLVHRLMDTSWALIFINDKAIIFVKRNIQNAQVIKLNEIEYDSARVSNAEIFLKGKSGIIRITLSGTSALVF